MAELSTDPEGGGGTGGGGGGGGGLEDLRQYADVLTTFAATPAGFILGAILSELLTGIETIVAEFIDAIRFAFVGSDGVVSATGTLGIADVPVFMMALVMDAGDPIANAALDTAGTVSTTLVDVAVVAGPLAPVVLGLEIAVLLVVTAFLLRKLAEVVLDFFPGVGGLL